MAEKIVIFGAGALAREDLQIIRDIQSFGISVDCCGFLVDHRIEAPTQIEELVYRALRPDLLDPALRFLVAVGKDGRASSRNSPNAWAHNSRL
jgi:hypothetical protein